MTAPYPAPPTHPYVPRTDLPYCAQCGLPEPNRLHAATPPASTPHWQGWDSPDDAVYGEPLLPYAGTSGYAGSVTSEERARSDDADGTTSQRQQAVLAYLAAQGEVGATWKEVDAGLGWQHHGRTTGALSVLHKAGVIDRLAETRPPHGRGKCEVYVLPQHVKGRETRQHGRSTPVLTDAEQRAMDSLWHAREVGAPYDPEDVNVVLEHMRRVSA